jgi:gamma-glutamylcyclotransferase (GGCT)/AIG2-like uncharacterized protein YtfP
MKPKPNRHEVSRVPNLFAYGTLMCPDIMREVAACLPHSSPGVLHGYCRRGFKGEPYPGLAPDSTGRVQGVLYRRVPASAWARLDRFEGPMYVRQTVCIELADGASLSADTYLVRTRFLSRLAGDDWSYAEFLRRDKATFARYYRGYAKLK